MPREADYHLDTALGEGNYRVMYSGTSRAFWTPRGEPGEQREALSLSFDQALGTVVGVFLRLGWQAQDAAVDFQAVYSGGFDFKGAAWGREADNIGIGFAYLNGGNSGHPAHRRLRGLLPARLQRLPGADRGPAIHGRQLCRWHRREGLAVRRTRRGGVLDRDPCPLRRGPIRAVARRLTRTPLPGHNAAPPPALEYPPLLIVSDIRRFCIRLRSASSPKTLNSSRAPLPETPGQRPQAFRTGLLSAGTALAAGRTARPPFIEGGKTDAVLRTARPGPVYPARRGPGPPDAERWRCAPGGRRPRPPRP